MEYMTRDEFLYRQIKGNRSLYRGLTFVYAAATLATVIMAIAALNISRIDGALALVGMGVGMAASTYGSWSEQKVYANALDEIGPSPVGVDTRRTFSEATAEAIALSRMDAKTLAQQSIAYGILALTMIGLGAFLVALLMESGEDLPLTLVGAGLAGGGMALLFMAIKAFRNWRIARYFESFL